jgi:quinol monooxygenase YgiN
LSIAPKPGYTPKIGVLVINSVAPGRTEDFEKSSKEVIAAIGKTNAKGCLAFKMVLGGDPNEYNSLVLFDSFADIQKFGPAFGKALTEAKLGPDAGTVIHREYTVIGYVPELSIQPADQ